MPRTRPNDTTLGPRLRDFCKQRRLSIAELARRTGLSTSMLRSIFRGERPAEADEHRRILRVLGLKATDIVTSTPTPTPLELERDALRTQADVLRNELAAAHVAPAQERDALQAQVDALRNELAAAHDARAQELTVLRARLPDVIELQAQVETLHAELATTRAAHSVELAELRDQHLRELAGLRTRFHEDQVAALAEGQQREEKLAAALNVLLVELDRRHPPAPPRPEPPPPPPEGPASATSFSVAGTFASVAVGLGSVAFGTWLLNRRG